jgi:hypothetical protein
MPSTTLPAHICASATTGRSRARFPDPAVARIASAPSDPQPWLIEAHALTRLDTTGALLLVRALRASGRPLAEHRIEGMGAADLALLRRVATHLDGPVPLTAVRSRPARRASPLFFSATVWQSNRHATCVACRFAKQFS